MEDKRNYDIIDGEIFDEPILYVIKPLETAKVYLNFSGLPSLLKYNEHFAIAIADENGK